MFTVWLIRVLHSTGGVNPTEQLRKRYDCNIDSSDRRQRRETNCRPERLQVFYADSKMCHDRNHLVILSHLRGAGDIPDELGQLVALTELSLSNNRLTGQLLRLSLAKVVDDGRMLT